MASGTPTNRTNIDLPVSVSNEILQKMRGASAIMSLARQIDLPGNGTAINVITGDPDAAWVGETALKPVSNPGLATKIMRAYKLAVTVPFSNEFRRDASALYNALIERLPGALAQKFDYTIIGGVSKPGSDFDNFASATKKGINGDTYGALVDADTAVATAGGILNGFALSPQAKSILLKATDKDGRPLFINSVAEGAIPQVLGSRTLIEKGLYAQGADSAPNTVGVAGDWTQALWGTVNNVELRYSSDAVLKLANGDLIYLFQQNMFAVIAEIEVGFRADVDSFVLLTDAENGVSA